MSPSARTAGITGFVLALFVVVLFVVALRRGAAGDAAGVGSAPGADRAHATAALRPSAPHEPDEASLASPPPGDATDAPPAPATEPEPEPEPQREPVSESDDEPAHERVRRATMRAHFDVTGRVVDASGRPIAGALVLVASMGDHAPWLAPDAVPLGTDGSGDAFHDLWAATDGLPPWPLGSSLLPVRPDHARTDERGTFFLPRLSAGWKCLSVRAPGHVSLERDGLPLHAARDAALGDVVLARGAELSGVVHPPVERIAVYRVAPRADPRLAPQTGELVALTDKEGAFHTDRLPAGPGRLAFHHTDLPPWEVGYDDAQPGELVELSVEVPRSAKLRGEIILDGEPDPEGRRPPPVLVVRAVPARALELVAAGVPATWIAGYREARVVRDTHFYLPGLVPGELYAVRAMRPDTPFERHDPWAPLRLLRADTGWSTETVVLDYRQSAWIELEAVPPPGSHGPVELRIRGGRAQGLEPDGPPLRRPTVRGEPIRLDDVRPTDEREEVVLSLRTRDSLELLTAPLPIAPALTSYVGAVRLAPADELRVRFVAAEDGAPIANGELRIETPRTDDGPMSWLEVGVSDRDGSASVPWPSGGPLDILLRASGRAPLRLRAGTLDRHAPQELERGGDVRVRVHDLRGRPIAGVPVLRRVPRGDELASLGGSDGSPVRVVTNADGDALFPHLSRAHHAFGPPARAGDAIATDVLAYPSDGEELERLVAVAPLDALEGRLALARDPLVGAGVRLRPLREADTDERVLSSRWHPYARTDADGLFRLRSVWAGLYELEITHARLALPVRETVVLTGSSTPLRVQLRTGSVVGRVDLGHHEPSDASLGLVAVPEEDEEPFDEAGLDVAALLPANVHHVESRAVRVDAPIDDDGLFRIDGIPVGIRVRLVAVVGDERYGASAPFMIEADGETRGVNVPTGRTGAMTIVDARRFADFDGVAALYVGAAFVPSRIVVRPLVDWSAGRRGHGSVGGFVHGPWLLLGYRTDPWGRVLEWEEIRRVELDDENPLARL